MAIEKELSFNDYVNVIKRRLPLVVSVFLITLLLATAIALKIPSVYESSATILIESQQVQSDPALTREKYATDRFEALKQVVMTNENLFRIADKYKLYGLDKKVRPREEVAMALRKNIKADLLKAPSEAWGDKPTFAVLISYNYYKPDETYNVTNEIVKLFLDENDKAGKLRATETAEFFANEAEKQKAALLKIENEVTKYKQSHVNSLPENKDMHLESLDRYGLDLRDIQRERSTTQAELRSLDVNLESAKAGIGIVANDGGGVATVSELEKLKLELEKVSGLYSESHPSVRALKRRIETLEKSGGVTTTPTSKPVTAQSVMVAKIQAQIETANAKLKSLDREEAGVRAKMSQLEGRVMQTAQTEGELGKLMRDYDNAKAAYAELKVKQDSAKIAKNIEMENKGERFVLTEAPILPEKPIKPNRIMLLILAFLGSIFCAIGLAVILELLDNRVRGVTALASIMKMQPIAAIPYITTVSEIKEKNQQLKKLVLRILTIAIVAMLLVHFLIQPLDQIADKILAKF